ncbi:Y-family DNA polymerase [Microbaculum marinum]|uniref:Y-family DNA polymerase n=1 Tax=Microbaculum marinum TaxID=1764581 RepID=UPI003611E586
MRLAAVDRVAAAAGLDPGLTLADARARRPDLETFPADPEADRRTLLALAEWAGRYTPLVSLDGPCGLVLDIAGCTHLFGGETALLADLTGRVRRRGRTGAAAIADTATAARALARTTPGTVVPPGGNAEAVAALPVGALEADPSTVATLDRLGLKRIGQLVGLPRQTLAARFGPDLLTRLDRALARADEPLSPLRAPPAFLVERTFAEPIRLVEDIERTIRTLAGHLAEPLTRHGQGARRLALTLFRLDGRALRIEAGLSRPARAPDVMASLLRERLVTFDSGLDTGEGIELVRLAAEVVEAFDAEQVAAARIAPDRTEDEEALARLADRLAARLGRDHVVRLVSRDSHIPERAAAAVPAVDGLSGTHWPQPLPRPGRAPERPLRLLAVPEPIEAIAEVPDGPPIRFRWRRVLRRIARMEGPERIAPEWWAQAGGGLQEASEDAATLTRDYFRVEDDAGRRYWVFRAGLFGRETARPRWYLHGLFG